MTDPLAKTASTAYDAALEVIASVEPRIAEATRQGVGTVIDVG